MVEVNKDSQKTIVAFVVGLLIGGLIVSAISGDNKDVEKMEEINATETTQETSEENSENEAETEAEVPALQVGEGDVVINNQAPSRLIAIESAVYPVSEGWIGVRDYQEGNLGLILGVVRFSESQGLVPNDIILQTSTIAGREYAVVIYTENGDFDFSLANDVQIDRIFTTFTAE